MLTLKATPENLEELRSRRIKFFQVEEVLRVPLEPVRTSIIREVRTCLAGFGSPWNHPDLVVTVAQTDLDGVRMVSVWARKACADSRSEIVMAIYADGRNEFPISTGNDWESDLAGVVREVLGVDWDIERHIVPWTMPPKLRREAHVSSLWTEAFLSGGRVRLVSSFSGRPLRPLKTLPKGLREYAAAKAVLVSASPTGDVEIVYARTTLDESGGLRQEATGRPWAGPIEKVPETFRPAALAAMEMAKAAL